MWKITNISNPKQNIKIATAKSNEVTVGVILEPGQFCITDSRMTSSIDAQVRRNFISVNEEYSNDLNLNLCEAYNDLDIDRARQDAIAYKG